MRIHCLTTGRVRRKRDPSGIRRYFADEWANETLPVNVFVLEHPDGLCLFDTGQTARAAQPGYFPGWYPFFRLSRFELTHDEEVAAQLRRLGHDADDVRWIVLSHLHTDHAGGVAAFEAAEILVSRSEWDAASGVGGRLRGYLPQYWPAHARVTLVDFEGPALGPFPGTHDVTGDGTLLLVPTPGHTRGHLAMVVREGHRTLLLGGDAALSAGEVASTAPHLARFCDDAGAVFLASHDAHATELLHSAAKGG